MLGSLRKVVRYPCPKSNLLKPAYMQVLKVQLFIMKKYKITQVSVNKKLQPTFALEVLPNCTMALSMVTGY